MGKEIKLNFTNLLTTINVYGTNQKEFHQKCFQEVLNNWFNNHIALRIDVNGGRLEFTGIKETDTHLILRYIYREV